MLWQWIMYRPCSGPNWISSCTTSFSAT
jgi:hypothetical protein